jgi:hypothetical protein
MLALFGVYRRECEKEGLIDCLHRKIKNLPQATTYFGLKVLSFGRQSQHRQKVFFLLVSTFTRFSNRLIETISLMKTQLRSCQNS